ncbi:MAG: hypothetical protein ACFHX7_07295 [Pseudomonadota bacterium]
MFAIRTFAMKATSGIGGLIGGFGLELIQLPENATVGEVAPETLNGLLFKSGPLYWMIVAAGMGFMAMHQLSGSRHKEILDLLRRNPGQTATGT